MFSHAGAISTFSMNIFGLADKFVEKGCESIIWFGRKTTAILDSAFKIAVSEAHRANPKLFKEFEIELCKANSYFNSLENVELDESSDESSDEIVNDGFNLNDQGMNKPLAKDMVINDLDDDCDYFDACLPEELIIKVEKSIDDVAGEKNKSIAKQSNTKSRDDFFARQEAISKKKNNHKPGYMIHADAERQWKKSFRKTTSNATGVNVNKQLMPNVMNTVNRLSVDKYLIKPNVFLSNNDNYNNWRDSLVGDRHKQK